MSRRDVLFLVVQRAQAGPSHHRVLRRVDRNPASKACFGTSSYRVYGTSKRTRTFQDDTRPALTDWRGARRLHTAARQLRAIRTPDLNKVDADKQPAQSLTEAEQRAYDRLRPIIDSLPGPIDWAVAYGSGVRHQANSDPSGKPPMTDFLLSTPSLPEFHSANLRQNPSHYPLTARILGGKRIAWLTERWGAGVWYVTMVNIRGLEVKYGVISTDTLKRDLEGWETLYVAGRLHKPILPLLTPSSLSQALSTNLNSALSLPLLLLPAKFPESSLWEQIAGISYAGDPRMSVPGAENPEKVKNIVRGEGAREGMRGMYGVMMERLGVRVVGDKMKKQDGGIGWGGEGEVMLEQPDTSDHRYSLFMTLPPNLRRCMLTKYAAQSQQTEPGSDPKEERRQWDDIIAGKAAISGVASQDWRKVIMDEVSNIIHRPALTQSFKGLFTAGFRKSFVYALAKFGKWLKGRQGKKKA